MIITALNNYYERLSKRGEVPEFGFTKENIDFEILLKKNGEIAGVHCIRERDEKGKYRSKRLDVPNLLKKRTSGINPHLFWDNIAYVLGIPEGTAKGKHNKFKEKMHAVLVDATDEGLVALRKFLDCWSPNRFTDRKFDDCRDEMLKSKGQVVFRIDNTQEYLHQRPAAKQLFKLELNKQMGEEGTCLVTGKREPVSLIHYPIKGVSGDDTSIVSFNQKSFCSYHKEQGKNAPVSERVGYHYVYVLNRLLDRGSRRRLNIGDATTIFWAEAEEEEGFVGSILDIRPTDGQESAELKVTLDAIAKGRPLQDLKPDLNPSTRIFVLGLSPNKSRLSVRFWHTDTLEDFTQKIARHYQDLCIEPLPWRTPPSVNRLLLATIPSHVNKDKNKHISPHLAGEMMRAIISGGNYPHSLLSAIVMRMRSDGDISGLRVALCKAVIVRSNRKLNKKEDIPVSLDTSVTNEGYLLGRWFAELEGAQRGALGKDVNATIRDQYYGSASATPASTFPTLIRKYQNHISKVGKKRKGQDINIEKRIGEIVDKLPAEFPKTLSLEDQGRFAIGYYHQRQENFRLFKKESESEENNE